MERIIKTEPGIVEIRTVYFDEKANGKEVIGSHETYRQGRIDNEILASEAREAEWDTVVIADEKAKEVAIRVRLGIIQTEMSRE